MKSLIVSGLFAGGLAAATTRTALGYTAEPVLRPVNVIVSAPTCDPNDLSWCGCSVKMSPCPDMKSSGSHLYIKDELGFGSH